MKVYICRCIQCKAVKAAHKNRKLKKKIKRLFNKKIRRGKEGRVANFYWA